MLVGTISGEGDLVAALGTKVSGGFDFSKVEAGALDLTDLRLDGADFGVAGNVSVQSSETDGIDGPARIEGTGSKTQNAETSMFQAFSTQRPSRPRYFSDTLRPRWDTG